MFRAFNLKFSSDRYEEFVVTGKNRMSQLSPKVLDSLKNYIRDDGSLDGTRLRGNWFPELQCSVFISHSHKDKSIAIGLAGWLHEAFKIDAFVDSEVWGHADRLLREIDERHCRNPGGETFSYERRNRSTAHVHALLSTALTGMIDRTECVMFLNTGASAPMVDSIEKTTSPWIYSEIETANRIRRRSKEAHRGGRLDEAIRKTASTSDFQVYYDLQLQKFSEITADTLSQWGRNPTKGPSALDRLYEIVPPSNMGE